MRAHRVKLFLGISKNVLDLAGVAANKSIKYGNQKADGGHDHRTNKGADRTPAQKAGDDSRRGPRPKGD